MYLGAHRLDNPFKLSISWKQPNEYLCLVAKNFIRTIFGLLLGNQIAPKLSKNSVGDEKKESFQQDLNVIQMRMSTDERLFFSSALSGIFWYNKHERSLPLV